MWSGGSLKGVCGPLHQGWGCSIREMKGSGSDPQWLQSTTMKSLRNRSRNNTWYTPVELVSEFFSSPLWIQMLNVSESWHTPPNHWIWVLFCFSSMMSACGSLVLNIGAECLFNANSHLNLFDSSIKQTMGFCVWGRTPSDNKHHASCVHFRFEWSSTQFNKHNRSHSSSFVIYLGLRLICHLSFSLYQH